MDVPPITSDAPENDALTTTTLSQEEGAPTTLSQEDFALSDGIIAPERFNGISKDSLSKLKASTAPVRKSIAAPDSSLSKSVQAMWHRADEMNFKARGDKDMSKDEVEAHLDCKSDPFKPLPEGHEERMMAAIKAGDLEALKQMDNVQIYQTYEDQKKEKEGEEYDQYQADQLILDARGIWEHFDTLRKIRKSDISESEWEDTLKQRKWSQFIRWYPTFAGCASDPTIPEYEVDRLCQMLEQKRMMEQDSAYTRAQADAAVELYGTGAYTDACAKAQRKKN